MRRIMWITGSASLGVVTCLPPAEAATVSVRPSTKPVLVPGAPPMELLYLAAAGEQNDVTVQVSATGGPWTVTDAGTAISVGAGCVSVDAHTAHCEIQGSDPFSSPHLVVADVRAGDLDDVVTLLQPPPPPGVRTRLGATFPLYGDGGPGNDTMSAEHSDGELHGGPGDDRLYGAKLLDGGGGRDELRGDERDSTFIDGDRDGTADVAPGPDVIDGGLGADVVSYRPRTRPVSVDLSAQRGGAPDEGDVVRGVESIVGGHGDDLLQGDAGGNVLDGGQGRDTLVGRSGSDVFVNGRGANDCGKGSDLVADPRASDVLERSCEDVAVDIERDAFTAYPVRRTPRSLWFAIHCPFRSDLDLPGRHRCSARVTIDEAAGAHRRIASGRSASGRWTSHRFRLPLTRVGRRLAARRKPVPAVVTLTIDEGGLPVLRWGIRF
jgi:hypothetical protein